MNTAIIVAAGSGSRFDPENPKQFVELLGRQLLVHTMEKFERAESVNSVVLVVAKQYVDTYAKSLEKYGFTKIFAVVPGGETRAESVRNGLNAVDTRTEFVAVHDGARPLVTVDEIDRTIARAKETGAACLVAAVTDTIKSIRGDEIAATLDRAQLRRALTPQAFKIEVLKKAFDGVSLDKSVTDECYLVERLGHPIAIVEGSVRNIKITHPEDLILAEALLSQEIK